MKAVRVRGVSTRAAAQPSKAWGVEARRGEIHANIAQEPAESKLLCSIAYLSNLLQVDASWTASVSVLVSFDKQIKRRDLLKTSAMLGIASAAGSVAPSLLKAEPAKLPG